MALHRLNAGVNRTSVPSTPLGEHTKSARRRDPPGVTTQSDGIVQEDVRLHLIA